MYCIDHQHGRFVTWLQTKNNVASTQTLFVIAWEELQYKSDGDAGWKTRKFGRGLALKETMLKQTTKKEL